MRGVYHLISDAGQLPLVVGSEVFVQLHERE